MEMAERGACLELWNFNFNFFTIIFFLSFLFFVSHSTIHTQIYTAAHISILIFSPNDQKQFTQMNTNNEQDDEPQPPSNRPDEMAEEMTTETSEMKQHEEENDVDKEKDKDKDREEQEQGDEFAIEQLERLSTRISQPIPTSPLLQMLCGAPTPVTRKFNKCPCGSVRYCDTKCQKKHWTEPRSDCKRLIAELKRRKQMKKKSERSRSSTATDTDADQVNAITSEEVTRDLPPLPKKEEMTK